MSFFSLIPVIFRHEPYHYEPPAALTRAPSGEFEQLQAKHKELFNCAFIERTDCHFQQADDIHQDKYLCVCTKNIHQLAVGTLRKSIALGGIGTTVDGITFLALGHIKRIEAENALEILTNELIHNNCEKSSIKFYAVGGVLEGVHEDDGSSFRLQKDLIKWSKKYNICGIKFNTATSEDTLQVLFNTSGMYYSKHKIFTPIEDRDFAFQEWF